MDIAAYCRVSTDKSDQLNSLEAQKKFFAEYARRTGDTLVKVYADEGISGTKIKRRRQFLKMLEDAEIGLFQKVVVKDISRFARNTVDLLQSIRRLKALGIETQFLTANMTNMGDSEFVLTIFGALAQEESANTSKRVKFGKRVNAQKGKVPNLAYGYDKTRGDYFNLAVNAAEAAVVRTIFEKYVVDGCGACAIARSLNARGIRTKRGCRWSPTAVMRILTNRLYTGRIVNGKQEVEDFLTGRRVNKDSAEWIVTCRPELRIVQDDVFEKVQKAVARRGQTFGGCRQRRSNRYALSNLIKCADCGWSFRRVVRAGRTRRAKWVCSKRNGRGAASCGNATVIGEEELLAAIKGYFVGLLSARKNALSDFVAAMTRRICAEGDDGQLKALAARQERLSQGREKALNMYIDGLISRDELKTRLDKMQTEADEVKRSLCLAEGGIFGRGRLLGILAAEFCSLDDVVDMSALTNAHMRRLVERIVADGEGNVKIYIRHMGEDGAERPQTT